MAERLTGLPERLRELALGQDDPDARDEDRLMWQAAAMLDQLAADKKRQADALDRMQRQRRHEKDDARKHRKEVDRDTKALVAQRDEAEGRFRQAMVWRDNAIAGWAKEVGELKAQLEGCIEQRKMQDEGLHQLRQRFDAVSSPANDAKEES